MKSIMLLSGGLDSTVCFKRAVDETKVELALTFDYGQAAAAREIAASREIAQRFGVEHAIIHLPWMEGLLPERLRKGGTHSRARSGGLKLGPKPDDEEDERKAATAVWVPNRNGVFVNIAGAFAEARDCDQIVAGFNAEEGASFPDNSTEYVEAANAALALSTIRKPRVVSYTVDLDKAGILRLARQIRAPVELVWSCYYGEEEMCGECLSCWKLLRALKQEGGEGLEPLASRFRK